MLGEIHAVTKLIEKVEWNKFHTQTHTENKEINVRKDG